MTQAAAAVPLILGAATAYYQYSQGQKAEKAAKQIGEANAARIAEETAEAARRLKKQQEETLSEQRARVAASGIQTTGSMTAWLADESDEALAQRRWLEKAGLSQAQSASLAGRRAGASASASATGAALGSFGSGVAAAGNWYQALA